MLSFIYNLSRPPRVIGCNYLQSTWVLDAPNDEQTNLATKAAAKLAPSISTGLKGKCYYFFVLAQKYPSWFVA